MPQKYVDVTLRVPVPDDFDAGDQLTLAAQIRQLVLDNGSDYGIEEVKIASVHMHSK